MYSTNGGAGRSPTLTGAVGVDPSQGGSPSHRASGDPFCRHDAEGTILESQSVHASCEGKSMDHDTLLDAWGRVTYPENIEARVGHGVRFPSSRGSEFISCPALCSAFCFGS